VHAPASARLRVADHRLRARARHGSQRADVAGATAAKASQHADLPTMFALPTAVATWCARTARRC
jgi:hypothetical protein